MKRIPTQKDIKSLLFNKLSSVQKGEKKIPFPKLDEKFIIFLLI